MLAEEQSLKFSIKVMKIAPSATQLSKCILL